MKLEEHPTVRRYRERMEFGNNFPESKRLESGWLKALCREAGADDVGLVEVSRAAIEPYSGGLRELMPEAKSLVCMAFRLNREDLRTPAHSVANLEFRHAWEHANHSGRRIAGLLRDAGIRALNAPAGFPMEMDRWPDQIWLTCDKIFAEQAGLGRMGWNRLVLHPEYGSAVVLGSILVDAELDSYDSPLDYNPCIRCKACVSVCPVGAVAADGRFDFLSCYTHNYRERMGGFSDWVENIAASGSVREYRRRVSGAETVSMWQNLSIGGQTRCDRCMAVCPAGNEAIGEYMDDRPGYVDRVVKRLRDKKETIYVVPGSDAEVYVTRKFPEKAVKRVSNGLRPSSVRRFLRTLPIVFQRNQSEGLDAVFHFTFTGAEQCMGTAVIKDKKITVNDGHEGKSDLHIIADSAAWIGLLAKETSILRALITRKIRMKGSPKLMKAFARCFPS